MSASDHVPRVATPADAAAVDALLQASYPALMAPAYDAAALAPALSLMTRSNPALLGSGTFYVVESGTGMLIGCGGWTLERPGTGTVEPNLAHIRHFATHPDWTRRGVGRAIYERCEAAARAAGATAFECYSSLNAEAFYRGLGFARVRLIDLELRPDVRLPAVLMQRDIRATSSPAHRRRNRPGRVARS